MRADKTTRIAFLTLLAVSLAAAMVPTLFPAVDFATSGYFLQTSPPVKTADWWWVDLLNEYVPMVFRSLAVACIPLWWLAAKSRNWRHLARPVAFVGLALLVGPGILVTSVKDLTKRARPHHVIEFQGTKQFAPALKAGNQCDDNCAFPSGHTSDGFFIASLMLIDPRRRWWWLAGGVVGGLAIGFARVSVGAHWLSDALWACPITLLGSWLVYLAFERYYPHKAAQTPLERSPAEA
jgi:lipid A 4'-phosphatase